MFFFSRCLEQIQVELTRLAVCPEVTCASINNEFSGNIAMPLAQKLQVEPPSVNYELFIVKTRWVNRSNSKNCVFSIGFWLS